MSPPKHSETVELTPMSCALHAAQLSEVLSVVSDIKKRLFIDNGTPCLQTRIDRTERITSSIVWLGSVIVVALTGAVVAMGFRQ